METGHLEMSGKMNGMAVLCEFGNQDGFPTVASIPATQVQDLRLPLKVDPTMWMPQPPQPESGEVFSNGPFVSCGFPPTSHPKISALWYKYGGEHLETVWILYMSHSTMAVQNHVGWF